MPAHARKDIVRKGEIGTYHTWSRCVQRAFLCGEDPVTGINYDYRREWIAKLLEYQASVFAVDIGNYTVLSNHQHLLIRLRPDIAKTWSDEQVAWRWKLAWPTWRNGAWVRRPTDDEIKELLAQPEKILKARENLADLSWFMARWKEPISKMANAENGTKGHFYEQRFGSREITDDGGNLCCHVYMDLNQRKAGMAYALEECKYSAIYDRLRAWWQRQAQASVEEFLAEDLAGFPPQSYQLTPSQVEALLADSFLSPIGQIGSLILVDVNGAALVPAAPPPPEQIVVAESDFDRHTTEDDQSQSFTEDLEVQAMPDLAEPRPSTSVPSTTDHGQVTARISTSEHSSDKKPTWKIHLQLNRTRRRRASDHVTLDMPIEQYFDFVRFSAEQIGSDSPRAPPDELAGALRQMGINPSKWISAIEHFETFFRCAVGNAGPLLTRLLRTGRKHFRGVKACRDVFG